MELHLDRRHNSSVTTRLGGVVLAAALALGSVTVSAVPAAAAGTKVVSGTIFIDSNANGARDTTTVAGQKDSPLAGVAVSLLCAADNTVLATATTSTAGGYEFGDGDLAGCAGEVKVRLSTDDATDLYATEPGSAGNLFLRTAAQTAETAPFTPAAVTPVVLDGLVKPTWKSNLAIAGDDEGWNGVAVKTGSPVFDADETEPGRDTSATNDLVRAGDTVTYTFSATFDSDDPLADTAGSAVLEQTINLTGGAVATFARIPAICTGTNPASSIKAVPSGTALAGGAVPPAGTTAVVLTCNLGAIGEERQGLLPSTSVWVSSTSTNGSSFTTTSRLYGVNSAGATTIQPAASVDNGPIKITSQPRYDLRKGMFTVSSATTANINGVTTSGYILYYHVGVTTDRKVGVEAFKQPLTLSEDFWAQYSLAGSAGPIGSTVPDLKWYLTACIPSPSSGGSSAAKWVGGTKTAATADYSASNSGTCTFTRDAAGDTAPYSLTLSGIDTSGSHYPKQTIDGTSLASGPYYVASYRLAIFVPMSELDRAVGATSDGAGALTFSNLVGDFDPDGISGASNYGSGKEPGYCTDGTPANSTGTPTLACDTMEDNSRSNNVAGPNGITIAPGTWSKYNFDLSRSWVQSEKLLPGASVSHDGAAALQPGQTGQSDIRIVNTGAAQMTGIAMCDVFDNTTMKLTTLDKVVDSNQPLTSLGAAYDLSGRYVYVMQGGNAAADTAAGWASNLAYQDNWTVQYAHFNLDGDDPISGGFSNTYNRYNGDWTKQRTASCADGATENTSGWQTSVAAAGGIDQVNAVRVVAKTSYTGLPTGYGAYLHVAYEQRDLFNGGPHAGQKIPSGTVAANFARVRSDSYVSGWSTRAYVPMSVNGESGNTDGDRWTVTRAEMNLKKHTITVDGVGTGAAGVGNTGTALAGNKVVWNVATSLTAQAADPAPVSNVQITDTLPKYATYNEECTAALTGGTPASSYTINADGTTTLVWNLGTLIPNKTIPPRIICTDTDPLAPNGTSLVNVAVITSPDVTPVSAHKDDHTVVLEQTGELRLRKDVDQTLDLEDQDQQYTLRVKNFSDTLAVQKPTVIDVLAHNNDATSAAGVNRSPASDYVGSNGLTGPVTAYNWSGTTPVAGTVYYTTVAPTSIPQDLNTDTNPAIWTTTITDYSTVTGFKFVAGSNLAIAGAGNASGLVLKYSTKQANNDPGDLYANRFTAFSNTFMNGGKYQLLTSNQTTVRVVGFSVGDLIWTDEDYDGKFTAGVDTPAPEGVKVQVFRDGATTPVATATTNADGRWIVNDLSTGDYYVQIPASEFASGGPLAKRVPATSPVLDVNTDKNEDADHHAIATADGGVRSSGLVTVSATVNGSTITGNEPAGDNVGGLRVSPGTTDDFTNLTVDLALNRVPGYTFAKTSSPASTSAVQVGDTITYTLTGTNTGSAPLDPVTITDDLAEVLAYGTLVSGSLKATVDGDPAPAAPTRTGNTLSWSGKLTEGQKVVVTYKVKVNTGTAGKTLRNNATSTATPPNGAEPITGTGAVSHPVGGFTFTKTAVPASEVPVRVGETVTYTLVGSNLGATTLDPVTVHDDLSAVLDNATLVAGSLKATIDGVAATDPVISASNQLSWTGQLAPGAKVTISYQVKVNVGAEGQTLTNQAGAEATLPGGTKITSDEISTKHPVPGYTFAKAASPVSGSAVEAGDTITYTLTGTNIGATTLDPVTVSDDLTNVVAHGTLVSGSLKATVDGDPATAPVLAADGKSFVWTGKLAIGEKVVVTYQVKVADDAAGSTLVNAATSSATPPTGEPFTGTGTASHPVGGFTFTKTAVPASGTAVVVGGTVNYSLVGSNIGATTLNPVTVKDDLSAVLDNATLVAGSLKATIDGVAATDPVISASNQLSWTGQLAPGAKVTISYQVKVNVGAEGQTLTNQAGAEATLPGGAKITPAEVSTKHPVPGFTLTKASDPESGKLRKPGDSITYTVVASNTGATVLDPVVVTDDLSEVLNHADIDPASITATIGGDPAATAAVLDVAGKKLTWTGKLAIEAKVTIKYTAKIKSDADGVVIRNSVSASATPPGGLAPITPPIVSTNHPTPGFSFTKTADPASTSVVVEGQKITYTLTGNNFGPTPLDPVVLTDDLTGVLSLADLDPASLKATIGGTAAAAPVVSGNTLTWTGKLAAKEVVKVTYTVTVRTGVVSATSILANKATASATPPGGEPIKPAEQITTHPISGFNLAKAAAPSASGPLKAGDTVSYTVTGVNTGAAPLAGVTVTDDLSGVLTAASLQGVPVATVRHADGTSTATPAPVSGSTLQWTGSLAVGDKVELTYTVVVLEVKAETTLRNSASANWTAATRNPTPVASVTTQNPVAKALEAEEDTGEGSIEGTGDNLAFTGAAGVGAFAGLGLILLIGGSALMAVRRRRTS